MVKRKRSVTPIDAIRQIALIGGPYDARMMTIPDNVEIGDVIHLARALGSQVHGYQVETTGTATCIGTISDPPPALGWTSLMLSAPAKDPTK